VGIDELLIGAELYCVTFVRDYVQFGFHCESKDAGLSAYALPTVTVNGIEITYEDIGYRDALCGLIDQIVEDVLTEVHESIKILFKSSDELLIKPNDKERETLVEYAHFHCGDIIQVWN
jgi:hypothetical protein